MTADRPIAGPLDIVVYHIGGVGDYGPATDILKRYPANTLLVVLEARDEAPEFGIEDRGAAYTRKLTVNRCISGKTGPAKFFVNTHGESSSLFPPAPAAMEEDMVNPTCRTWGANTQLDRQVELDTVSIDDFVGQGLAPPPDILSIDAQGAECDIMQGGSQSFENMLGVVSEVEFSEIYLGQGLFHRQHEFLLNRGIRLADVYNVQYWYPGSIAIGEGFLTVGEAVWLRTLESLTTSSPRDKSQQFHRLLKLGAIAFGFRRKSLAYKVADLLLKDFQKELAELGNHPFWRDLTELHSYVNANSHNHAIDNEFFLRSDPTIYIRRAGESHIDGRRSADNPQVQPIADAVIAAPRLDRETVGSLLIDLARHMLPPATLRGKLARKIFRAARALA
jgi:FkbM family methyltransferase